MVDVGRDDTNVMGKDFETEKAAAGSDSKDVNPDREQLFEGNSLRLQEEYSGDNPKQLMKSDNEYSPKKCQEQQEMFLDKIDNAKCGALYGETRLKML